MLFDVGSKLAVARVKRYARFLTFRNAALLALLLPAMDMLDPSGIVVEDRVVSNRQRVVIFGGLQGKNGSLLSPFIMAG